MQLVKKTPFKKSLMGVVCEFYRVNDNIIDEFLKNPKEYEEYFDDNYTYVFGKFHHEGDNMFYCDKAWDIARFLIQQNDHSAEKVLDGLLGKELENTDRKKYIKSTDVKKIYDILNGITLQKIEDAYDVTKMQDPYVYKAGWYTKEEHWDYILEHIDTFYKAFKKAAENNDGLIISLG